MARCPTNCCSRCIPILTNVFVNNLAFKALTVIVLVPIWMVLFLLFQPNFSAVTGQSLLLAVPALALGFAIRFLFGAMHHRRRLLDDTGLSLGEFYWAVMILFSGQFVPLTLLPAVSGSRPVSSRFSSAYLPHSAAPEPPDARGDHAQLRAGSGLAGCSRWRCSRSSGAAPSSSTRPSARSTHMHTFRLLITLVQDQPPAGVGLPRRRHSSTFCEPDVAGLGTAGLSIIFTNTNHIAGWRLGDILALLGVFQIINTFMAAIVWPNTEKFNRGIRDGTLDYTLLQPVNSQFMVSFSRMVIWNVWDVFGGRCSSWPGSACAGSEHRPAQRDHVFCSLTIGRVDHLQPVDCADALTFWFTKFDNNVTLMQALYGYRTLPGYGVSALAAHDRHVCRADRRRNHGADPGACAATWSRGRWCCSSVWAWRVCWLLHECGGPECCATAAPAVDHPDGSPPDSAVETPPIIPIPAAKLRCTCDVNPLTPRARL